MTIGRTNDESDLVGLPLRPVRPAIRFSSGPLYVQDETGALVETGHEVLHMYTPSGEDT